MEQSHNSFFLLQLVAGMGLLDGFSLRLIMCPGALQVIINILNIIIPSNTIITIIISYLIIMKIM